MAGFLPPLLIRVADYLSGMLFFNSVLFKLCNGLVEIPQSLEPSNEKVKYQANETHAP